MKDIRQRAFVGFICLAAAGLLSMGCSSSNNSTGTGGSTGHTGGSTGTGGSGTGGSGTGGSGTGGSAGGGGGAALGCTMSDAPPMANILDATSDAGLGIMGGSYSYGTPTPTAAIASGNLTISLSNGVNTGTSTAYIGAGLYFNGNTAGNDCVDASTYTGISFDMSGSFSGCAMNFSINDSEHTSPSSSTPPDPKASCTAASCYAPQLTVASTDLPKTYMVPFAGTGAPSGGGPATAIDPMKLEGVGWNFSVPPGADAGGCKIDLTIKNLKFYK